MNDDVQKPGGWIANAGCGLAVALVFVAVGAAVAIRIVRWGMS